MEAVFFPFTVMTGSVLVSCGRFFKKMVVFQATADHIPRQMKEWQAQGRIDIRALGPGQTDLAATLRDYRAWARDHQGGDISVFKYYKDRIPFFDDTSVAQIKRDIRAAAAGQRPDPASAGSDRLMQARLFLQMAQEFDEQSLDIDRNLKAQEDMERVLFETLRGEGGLTPMPGKTGTSLFDDGPFGYMLFDRLSAWARVMLAHGIFDDVFVTSSREAIELAVGDLPETESRVHLQRIPGFRGNAGRRAELQEAFMDHLKRLSRMSPFQFHENAVPRFAAENGDEDAAIEVYTISGTSPPDFFYRFVQNDAMVQGGKKHQLAAKNTILALIPPAEGV